MSKAAQRANEKWLNASFDITEKGVTKSEDGVQSITITGYANTTVEDRAGDVIPSEAWLKPKAMGNYLKNPIVLFQHDHSWPIGKMVDYSVDEKGLRVVIEIYSTDEKIFNLVKQGVLKAFSVGFRITDYAYDVDEDVFTITELELHEISVVSIPCNQDSTFELEKSMDSKVFSELKKSIRSKALNGKSESDTPVFKSELEKLAFALGLFK